MPGMMRTSVGLTTILSAVAVASALTAGCSARRPEDGVVTVGLQLNPRFTIDTIHWRIRPRTEPAMPHAWRTVHDRRSGAGNWSLV